MNWQMLIIAWITIGLLGAGCGTVPQNTPAAAMETIASQEESTPSPTTDLSDAPPSPAPAATLVRKTYTPSEAAILNPERGYFYWTDLLESDFSNARELGYTLIYGRVFLKDYTTKLLDDAILQKLNVALQNVRKAGVKCILRFTYSDAAETVTDAPLNLILQHIAQLKPLLSTNADIIHVMQAGFIGRWGEWHSSTNGLDTNADARKQVLDAILNALPAERHVVVRTPMFKESYITSGGTQAARIGHHNDCFLASPTDFGTYADDAVPFWKNYIASDGLLTPVGGETCFLNPPRSSCETASAELASLHYSFLNGSTGDGVTAAWKTQGCFDKIGRQLGYRFLMTEAELNDRVRPGETLHVSLTLKNEGYAPLYHPRTAYLVLKGGATYAALISVNWGQLKPGATLTVVSNNALPKGISEGSYTLSLWLPDANIALKINPHYDIQLSNTEGNVISPTIIVDRNAGIYSETPNTAFEPL